MRRIVQQRQFRNDLRRQKRRGKDIEELIAAVEVLAEYGGLPDATGRIRCEAGGRESWNVTSSLIGF